MRLRQIIEHTVFSEMPLHSYHLNKTGKDTKHMASTVKNPNYEKSLIKFMKRFPGPDWIVIVGLLTNWRDDDVVKKYLFDKGISEQVINNSIIFIHDGMSLNVETVTPWILVHNFAHAIDLDGKSHVIYPLLGYEELSPSQEELDDPKGRFKEQLPQLSSNDPNDVWFPGSERSYGNAESPPKEIVKKVQQDLKFKSAGVTPGRSAYSAFGDEYHVPLDIDELCCEIFTEYMKHGKIRSKNNIDYSKVEQYFYKILESLVGKVIMYRSSDG